MADDRAPKPAPRPRRRRTDIDPNAPTPPVANERRRRKQPAAATDQSAPAIASEAPASGAPAAETAGAETPAADTASTTAAPEIATPEVGAGADVPQPFHVPGHGTAAAATIVADAAATATATTTSATTAAGAANADAPSSIDPGRAWLARLEDRSLDPNICPFLRATADGKLLSPVEMPDPSNRCAALNEAVPQSLRQQELVCLSSGHVNCPRYLRGSVTATETPMPVVTSGRTLTTPIFVSLVILVLTVSASFAFVMARGGLVLSGDVPSPSSVGGIPSPSAAALASPSAASSPSIAPTPSASASVVPSDTPVPSATPEPTASPTPTSDRYKLLTKCPDAPNCWIYTVRHGDNVFSIAHYFGVSTDSIYARNPWLKQTGLRAGQHLRLPPPTR